MVADCVGLIKAFFWTANGTTENKYASNNCPDRSANSMFDMCKVKGNISTIPPTPGLVVWNSGHIGVSLDGVWAIEARGFNYGVVKTRIRDRSWTKWGQLPASMLDYVDGDAPASEPGTCPYAEPTGNVKKGMEGTGVAWVQWMLEACGYDVGTYGVDGDFGSDTLKAVKSFQRMYSLEADGVVKTEMRAKLKEVYAFGQEATEKEPDGTEEPDDGEDAEDVPDETPQTPKTCPYAEPSKNLRKGDRGDGVKWAQWMLKACGYDVGSCGVDGDFGSDTLQAVRKFQTGHSLDVDGIVGEKTRAMLKKVLGAKTETEPDAEEDPESPEVPEPPAGEPYTPKGKIADVSKWQGKIDWTKAARELDFCILRAQYGDEKIDEKYLEYARGCEEMGIPYGAYSYCLFNDKETAREEARFFAERVKDTHPLYLVLDLEPGGVKARDIRAEVSAYIAELRALGHARVGLYVAHHAYKAYNIDVAKADFVWIPRYGKNSGKPEKRPSYPCDLWQFTSNGKVAGIKGRVDLNQLMDESRMAWFRGEA